MIRNVTIAVYDQDALVSCARSKRNNDREWFQPRKDEYETHVRAADGRAARATRGRPANVRAELIADPKVSLFRVYRDTRFSSDKTPHKTHVAARFPLRGVPKGEGAGLYFEIAPGWVWMGGGMYMPTTADLHDIRAQIAATHPRGLHKVVTAPAFKRAVGELDRRSTDPRAARICRRIIRPRTTCSSSSSSASCEYEAVARHEPALLSRSCSRCSRPSRRWSSSSIAAIEPRLTQAPLLVSEAPTRSPRQTAAHRPAPAPMW